MRLAVIIFLVAGCTSSSSFIRYNVDYSTDLQRALAPELEDAHDIYSICLFSNYVDVFRENQLPLSESDLSKICEEEEKKYYRAAFVSSFPGREATVEDRFRHNTARISVGNTRSEVVRAAKEFVQ